MVAIEVTGCYGKSMVAKKVTGCYGKSMVAIEVTGGYGKPMVAMESMVAMEANGNKSMVNNFVII
jgi:hypothetical protein